MTVRSALGMLLLVGASACSAVGTASVPSPRATTAVTPTATMAPAGQIEQAPERLTALDLLARPAQPAMTATFQAALVTDHCVDRDLPAPAATDDSLTVLDRSYALPADAVPPDLVPAADAGFGGASASRLVRAVLVEDLSALRADSVAAGLTIDIESAYRSYDAQAQTFDSWAARLGYEAALERTARPGHSEHQLGTAFDFTSPGWQGRFGDWALESAEGAWLAAHAWEFGFVMSYPNGSRDRTCFGYEPWHYRWIGQEAAAELRESGLTLREFLARGTTAP